MAVNRPEGTPGEVSPRNKSKGRFLSIAGVLIIGSLALAILFLFRPAPRLPPSTKKPPLPIQPRETSPPLEKETRVLDDALSEELIETGLLAEPITLTEEEKSRGRLRWQFTTMYVTLAPQASLRRLKDRITGSLDQLALPLEYDFLRQGRDHLSLNVSLKGFPVRRVDLRYPITSSLSTPQIAIVIDDLGQDYQAFLSLLEIDAPLTFSILPFTPHSVKIAKKAYALQRETLLHLPMEPKPNTKNNLETGMLLTGMSDQEIVRRLAEDVELVPFLCGVNNHKGSKFTEDEEKMGVVLRALKEMDLIFLDSSTTSKSVGYGLARRLGVETAKRDVFLDNSPKPEYVRKQMLHLARRSREKGRAIGIGHPYPETIAALREIVPELKEEGFEFVPVSRVMD